MYESIIHLQIGGRQAIANVYILVREWSQFLHLEDYAESGKAESG